MGYQFPSYMSKYTLPVIIDNKYITYITFDEDDIEDVRALTSENQYDITSEVNLVPIDNMPKSVFKKKK